jgi:hypothetical protein
MLHVALEWRGACSAQAHSFRNHRSSKSFSARIPSAQKTSFLKSSGLCSPPLKSSGSSAACYNCLPVSLCPKGCSVAILTSVGFTGENEVDRESLRARLRKMTDSELLRYGRAAKSMCSPDAYFGQAPRQTVLVQLEEARAELERRKSKKESET